MLIEPSTVQNFNTSFCNSGKFVHLSCSNPEHVSINGQGHVYPVKHLVSQLPNTDCEYCIKLRAKTIIAKAMARYNQIKRPYDIITLWTVGTSLEDSPKNREIIIRYWKLFGSRLRTYSKREGWAKGFQPLMNALESGSKGGKLHYHFAVRS